MAAAAVVPLLAYGAVSILSHSEGAQSAVIAGNQDVAKRVGEQIELYITSSVRILKAVAAEMQQTGLVKWQQDRILKNFVLQFREFTELTLLDESGRAVVSSRLGQPTTDSQDRTVSVSAASCISPFSVDDDLLPSGGRRGPPRPAGEGGGWLIGRLRLEELWRMVDGIRVGERGIRARGDQRRPAHRPRQSRRRSPAWRAADNSERLIHSSSKSRDASYHPTRSRRSSTSPTAREVLGVGVHVSTLGWTVIVEQPVSEAFAIPSRVQRQLVHRDRAWRCSAMLTLGYVWGRSFIDPILRLTRGTRALAAGRLDERVVVDSNDELGQLGSAFNNMADRLVELQEDVRKKERQAMFGRISIGLVHDLSHPIQNIGNSCKLIVKMWDDTEYRESFKRTVERELAQVKRVLDDLRNVARPIPLERFPIDVNKAITELVDSMVTTAESAGVTLETEQVFGPLFVEGDLFALNRVYRNLIINALQATPPRGRVVVRTLRQNDQAVIEVADTGTGIPPERIETIFDDFVTTKRRGLGLGLAISKKIVEQLGGTIAVTSQVGLGSTFSLRFPLTKARPSQLAAV